MSNNEELNQLGLTDLTTEQKKALKKLILSKEKAAKEAAESGSRASSDLLKYGATASRRPEIFDPENMAITDFVEQYESYITILNLKGTTAVRAFITYLNTKTQNQVREAKLDEVTDWDTFKERAIDLIQSCSKQSRMLARLKLQRAKQLPSESIMDFGDRLRTMGKAGYPEQKDKPLRETELIQALCMGVKKDEIGVELLHEANGKSSFNDLLRIATRFEMAYTARGEGRPQINVLATERAKHTQQEPVLGQHFQLQQMQALKTSGEHENVPAQTASGPSGSSLSFGYIDPVPQIGLTRPETVSTMFPFPPTIKYEHTPYMGVEPDGLDYPFSYNYDSRTSSYAENWDPSSDNLEEHSIQDRKN